MNCSDNVAMINHTAASGCYEEFLQRIIANSSYDADFNSFMHCHISSETSHGKRAKIPDKGKTLSGSELVSKTCVAFKAH